MKVKIIENTSDKEQMEFWKNIYMFMNSSYQIQDDYLQIDKDRESAKQEEISREKWLLDNWQLIRPSKSIQRRRNPINIFNINK